MIQLLLLLPRLAARRAGLCACPAWEQPLAWSKCFLVMESRPKKSQHSAKLSTRKR